MMRTRSLLLKTLGMAMGAILLLSIPQIYAAQQSKPQTSLNLAANRNDRRTAVLAEEVRHQLVMLPYYSVFDWLQAEVKPDGTVVLMGDVTRPSTKDDAGSRVKSLEAATNVVNDIRVLPLSPMDDQLRAALFRSIFRFGSPLFRYSTQSVPPIHIIVENGHVTLKGVVLNQMDSQLAEMAANRVPGVFEVKNELQIEQQ